MTKRYVHVNQTFDRLSIRLRENPLFFPFLYFISFQLVLILTAYILSGSNPRAGNPSNPIEFQTEPFPDVPLWFSVTPIGDEIVVTTSDRKIFKWKQSNQDIGPLKGFMEEMKRTIETEVRSVSLSGILRPEKSTAVIAVDRHLTYAHIIPIIVALSEVGIRNYALETKLTHVGAK